MEFEDHKRKQKTMLLTDSEDEDEDNFRFFQEMRQVIALALQPIA
jgi:hypothetical protein